MSYQCALANIQLGFGNDLGLCILNWELEVTPAIQCMYSR